MKSDGFNALVREIDAALERHKLKTSAASGAAAAMDEMLAAEAAVKAAVHAKEEIEDKAGMNVVTGERELDLD